MQDNLKPIMDELALVLVKLVETAAYAAVAEARAEITAQKAEAPAAVPVETPVVEAAVEVGKKKLTRRVFPKPCPVCKVENVRRAYSYLCKEHTSDENIVQYRGWMKAEATVASETEAAVEAQKQEGTEVGADAAA
jgi:hypothetical protein